MKDIEKRKEFFVVSVAFLISALSAWMILAAFDSEGNMNIWGYVAGVLFWLGLLGGIAGYILFFRKAYPKPNVLKFFSNKPAIAADGIFILSAAVTIYGTCRGGMNQIVEVAAIFLLLLSLYMHFLLNGKVFTEILLNSEKGKGVREE